MPGALIVSLAALYKATFTELSQSKTSATGSTKPKEKKVSSSLTHVYKGYNYYVKALLGTIQKPVTSAPKENALLVSAVRENILAAGDTCSRAILIAAVLGAAYGEPPVGWWEKLYPVLSGEVEDAAYSIADYASKRLQR